MTALTTNPLISTPLQVQNARARYGKVKIDWDVVGQEEVPISARFDTANHPESSPGLELEVVYENQRWWPFSGWAGPAASDPAGWTTKHGWKAVPPNLYEVPSEVHGWWRIEDESTDSGWTYAFDFNQQFHAGCSSTDMVR